VGEWRRLPDLTDYWNDELDKIVGQLQERLERLAQDRASTHAVLHAKDRSEEWKRHTRLELELTHEVEFLRYAIKALNARLAARQALVDEQVGKREEERGG
jgi:uncharacterized protein YydD (DUF2326 family)